jgi:WD40 repeat protein
VDVTTHAVIAKAERAHTNGPAQAMDFSPSGDSLVTAGRDGLVKVWHLPDLQLTRTFSVAQSVRTRRAIDGPVTVVANSVAFSHDGATLAAGTAEGSVYFWDTATGKDLEKYLGDKLRPDHSFPSGIGDSVIFTPDDKWVLTTDPDGRSLRILGPRKHKEYPTAISTGSDAQIVGMDGSASDGSIAIAYREYHPGSSAGPTAKFSIWSSASTTK